MFKKWLIALVFTALGMTAYSQTNPADTVITPEKELLADTSIDYDELFRDFEDFMDSILTPRSYFMPSLSIGRGYFNFLSKDNVFLETTAKLAYSPMLTWYHKSGFGLNLTGYVVDDERNTNFYQFSFSPSFDYLRNHDLATGISYTRYFNKDSVPFYTSPLRNELYGYFTYRKWWFKPMVALSYGWGSRSDYNEREDLITSLRLRPRGYTYINTTESISDFSVMASVRHDFYWLDVFATNDHIRITPQVNFTSGTQKFGFNQTSNTYGVTLRNASNVLYSTENIYLDDQIDFQPLSLTLYLRGEYSIGKFFIQPQFALDYYFPADTKNFSSLVSVNVGLVF
jgi:hypothetical protein